jgi:hypothetical protein
MKGRRFVISAVLLALVVGSIGLVGAASAQAPTAYYVGFQIQNPSTTTDATVIVEYYNQDGSGAPNADYVQTITVPKGKSRTVITTLNSDLSSEILAPPPAIRGATSFAGSVIISSSEKVVAIANEAASVNNPYGSASYNGIPQEDASATVYAPLITKIGQPDTTINIQNPNNAQVSLQIQYTPGVYGRSFTENFTLPAKGSDIREVPSGALDTSGRFLGSAKVTVTTGGNVAAVVDEIYTAPGQPRHNARQSYNGFAGGADKMIAPLIQKNDAGVWYTGLQVMNLGPGSATVKVSYNGLRGSGTSTSCNPTTPVSGLTEPNFTLAENESKTILTEFGGALDSVALANVGCFRGAATVEVVSGTGQVAAIVSVAGEGIPQLAVYRAFDPAGATTKLSVPLIEKYLGVAGANGWSTGVQVANLGTASTTVNATFNVTCDGTAQTVTDSATVAKDSSVTFLQLNGFATGSLGTRQNCLGSATFESTGGQPIAAVVQQSFFGSGNPFTGDVLLAFEAFNE